MALIVRIDVLRAGIVTVLPNKKRGTVTKLKKSMLKGGFESQENDYSEKVNTDSGIQAKVFIFSPE